MKYNSLETFQAKIARGETAYGSVITLGMPTVAEMAAACGFDFVWIDMEHSPITVVDAQNMLIALRSSGCAPLVRVPWNVNYLLKPILDMAPAGVIVPMVNDAKSAEAAVRSCRYPAQGGERGFSTVRNREYGAMPLDEYLERSKRDPLVILQIEHRDAVKNIDEILRVEGIGSICIGPYDLSASYNKTGQFDDPEIADAIDEVREKTLAAGVMLGGFCATPFWDKRFMNWKALCCDADLFATAFRRRLAEAANR